MWRYGQEKYVHIPPQKKMEICAKMKNMYLQNAYVSTYLVRLWPTLNTYMEKYVHNTYWYILRYIFTGFRYIFSYPYSRSVLFPVVDSSENGARRSTHLPPEGLPSIAGLLGLLGTPVRISVAPQEGSELTN